MRGAIGIFDSGVGGLTVLGALHEALPNESTIYLGDTARVPYGTKSPEVVRRYARNNARFLLEQGVKLLVVACNTATAHALETLEAELPIPVIGVVEPGAQAAVARSASGRIGVIGTAGTIASGAYQKAITRALPTASIVARACPLLVPLAEEGWIDGEVPRAVVERYLGELRGTIDALVLGCTHYPLHAATIASVLGPNTVLVDSAQTTASAVAQALVSKGLSAHEGTAVSRAYYVTDVAEHFRAVAGRFLGAVPAEVQEVDLT